MHIRLLLLLVLLHTTGRSLAQKGEFRGVWVATAYHIDWPEEGRMLPRQQRADFLDILDFYRELNFDAVFVQVRVAGDAFYDSDLSPWSRFLSGEEGEAGDWSEDPLDFMIRETQARGMQFHAWLNPFRATLGEDPRFLDEKHIVRQHPEWAIRYGHAHYLDPGLPEARAHVLAVIEELITNYEVDGIHFDDYYYPYPIAGEEFNDRSSFVTHGILDFDEREDWRRANIDSLIQGTHLLIAEKAPGLQFGVSPFGIWRNGSDDERAPGLELTTSTYDHLFADPLLWIDEGWIDYIVPQLYWKTSDPNVNFRRLARWWNEEAGDVPVYLGSGMYQWEKDEPGIDEAQEMERQVRLGRSLPNVDGHVFFSARSLMARPDLVKRLQSNIYQQKSRWPTTD